MMPSAQTPYDKLEHLFERLAHIEHAISLMHWDSHAMMPEGGAEARSRAVAELDGLYHEILVEPHVGAWLDEAEAVPSANPWQAANVREMRRVYTNAAAVPLDLVRASSLASSQAEQMWRSARKANDFLSLCPYLEEVFRLQREVGAARGAVLGCGVYNGLLAAYEPGTTAEAIDAHFADLAAFLKAFIPEILELQQSQPQPQRLNGPFSREHQKSLAIRVMQAMGFDFNRGRIDSSPRSSCSGGPDDVRIATRFNEGDFLSSLITVVHETGRALYEQGRPRDWLLQPVGQTRSFGLYESQALLMAMGVGRGRNFMSFAAPLITEAFGGTGPGWNGMNLYQLTTQVERSFIRTQADEVTYPTHIILRYRLERAIIAGDLAVRDLPGAWGEGQRDLLGVVPPTDAQGCLQDIQWPSGRIGNFPSYTLGSMAAAQFYATARMSDSELHASIAHGDFGPLLHWLRAHVHSKGSLLSSEDLMIEATGRPLDTIAYKQHLIERYRNQRGTGSRAPRVARKITVYRDVRLQQRRTPN